MFLTKVALYLHNNSLLSILISRKIVLYEQMIVVKTYKTFPKSSRSVYFPGDSQLLSILRRFRSLISFLYRFYCFFCQIQQKEREKRVQKQFPEILYLFSILSIFRGIFRMTVQRSKCFSLNSCLTNSNWIPQIRFRIGSSHRPYSTQKIPAKIVPFTFSTM